MSTRIYDAKLLDFQIAQCSDAKSPLGGPVFWIKADVEKGLKAVMDVDTYSMLPERFIPVSLRWRTSSALGFPLTPFRVYKRKKSIAFAETAVPFTTVNSTRFFINGPYWKISFKLKNAGLIPEKFFITPLDQNQEPIADAEISRFISQPDEPLITFTIPNMNGVRITGGQGAVINMTGIRMEDFMNDGSWQLIETVGLPYNTNTIPVTTYQNSLQGFPTAPVSGYQAAVNRVAIAKMFIKPPELSQPDGTLLPTWETPQPLSLVKSYHQQTQTLDGQLTGILYDITEMLERVHSSPKLYDGMQSNFQKIFDTKGFSDDGVSYSEKALIKNPVCGTTLLGVATDCWNALGLGFGTTDLAKVGDTGTQIYLPECEYMVTAAFRIPRYKMVWEGVKAVKRFEDFDTYEVASLAHQALPLYATANLNNETFAENRPQYLDKNFSDDVKLFWDKPGTNVPVSYAIAVQDPFIHQLAYLNADRPFMPGIKRPYLAASRADNDAPDVEGSDAANLNRFFHHRSERSDTVPAFKNYYVAATDVFGRWSTFRKTVSTLLKAPQVNAEIITGQFVLEPYGGIDPFSHTDLKDHIYPGVLELIVAWHWDDRSPYEINIGGHFQDFPKPPDKLDTKKIVKSAGIWLNKDGTRSINLSIGFNGTVPYMKKIVGPQAINASPFEAEVIIDKTYSAPPNTIAYKVRIKGFHINFEQTSKLGFAAYVRSSVNNVPTAFTGFGNPKMLYTLDPLPRNPPVLPPDIQWGSLPDATNVSRFRVSFKAVPNVAGYAIYRATEASLRQKLGLLTPDEKEDIFTRRDQLFAFAGEDKEQARQYAKDAFIRISSNIMKEPMADVILPGDLEGLYIYAMTTFTDQRVESDFSNWLYVSVPRRYTPPAPVITAFTNKKGTMRDVKLRIEIPQGVRTEKLDIFSTKKSYLATSLDLMGLPVTSGGFKSMPADWKAYGKEDQQVSFSPEKNESDVSYYEITKTVDAGWQPIHYRAAGFGMFDQVHGKLPGRSKSSNMVAIQVAPPDDPPEIDATIMPFNSGFWRMDILATADLLATSFGNFKLTLQKLNTTSNLYEDILVSDIPAIGKKHPSDVIATDLFYLHGKDVSGKYAFEYYAPIETEAWYQIIVTDPLGRTDAAKVHYRNPVVAIKSLAVKLLAMSVEVSFETNIINKGSDLGHYKLEIFTQGKKPMPNAPLPARVQVYMGLLESLETTIPANNPAVYMETPIHRAKFYTYHAVFSGSDEVTAFTTATVIIVITDPNGKKTELSNGARILNP